MGHDLPETRLDDRLKRIAINHCCTVVYGSEVMASGSTSVAGSSSGAGRGIMLSHDNLTWCSKMLLGFLRAPGFNRLPSPGEEVLLSFLPVHCSVAAHAVDVYYSMSIAGTLCFYEGASSSSSFPPDLMTDASALFEALSEVQPTVFFATPAVYEKIYHRLREARSDNKSTDFVAAIFFTTAIVVNVTAVIVLVAAVIVLVAAVAAVAVVILFVIEVCHQYHIVVVFVIEAYHNCNVVVAAVTVVAPAAVVTNSPVPPT